MGIQSHDESGENPHALLVLPPDQELTAAEFTNFMQDRFVTNKEDLDVGFADAIPKPM